MGRGGPGAADQTRSCSYAPFHLAGKCPCRGLRVGSALQGRGHRMLTKRTMDMTPALAGSIAAVITEKKCFTF